MADVIVEENQVILREALKRKLRRHPIMLKILRFYIAIHDVLRRDIEAMDGSRGTGLAE